MASPADYDSPNSEAVRKTVLILVAVALNILELAVPRIPLLPWLKPGLANSITIIWIIRYGTADAVLFSFIRVWISSFYFGMSLVTITLALSGGVLSTIGMGVLWHFFGRQPLFRVGTIGTAVAGALLHNIGQLGAVYFMFARNSAVVYQLPAMGIASLLFGILTGLLTPALWKTLMVFHPNQSTLHIPEHVHTHHIRWPKMLLIGLCVAAAAAIAIINEPLMLAGGAVVITLLAAAVSPHHARALLYPVRFWFLFLFIAFFNLLFSYGTRIESLPLITHEGVTETVRQSLRLWSWIELSILLQSLQVNALLFKLLKKAFPKRADSLAAGLFALEFFADIIAFVKSAEGRAGLIWHKPKESLPLFVERIQTYIIRRIEESGVSSR